MKLICVFLLHFFVLPSWAQETVPIPYNGDSSEVLLLNDDLAEFPGGQTAKKRFIDSNLVYPDYALTQGLEGNCFVKFVVEKDGALTNIKVMRGIVDCPDCDREAVRIVQLMPKWKPGMVEGKPVRSYYNLCITFKMPPIDVPMRDHGGGTYIGFDKGDKIIVLLDESPEFVSGDSNLKEFLLANLTYPERALREGLTGKCYAQFSVLADGSVVNPRVIQGVPDCPECDEEAIRVINLMPKWKKGSMAYKINPTTYNLCVSFTLRK